MVNKQDDFRPSNHVYVVTGTLIIWACYLFFTGGKTYGVFVPRANAPPKVFMITFLGAAAGGLTSMLLKPFVMRPYKHLSWYDGQSVCSGILAGLVSISSGADRIENWAAICIGIIGATFYVLFCKWLESRKIDDPVEGSAVHMICGMWGLLATGFFDN